VGISGPPLAERWLSDTPRPPRRGPAGQSGCSVALGATVLGCVLRGVRLRGLRGWRGLILRAGRHAFLELAHGLTERARQFRQLLGAEEEHSESERDPEILWS